MSSFVSFESRCISLVERSLSSFVLVYLLYAGDDLLLSGNANEGCYWKVQTDEGVEWLRKACILL
jgi:hypothetical protein